MSQLSVIPTFQFPSFHKVMTEPRILIADDDRTVRKGMAFELRDLDCVVHEASSVREAVDLLQREKVDLVISDLKIPEVADGMKIIEETKRIDSNSMVLVITGYGSIELA